MGVRDRERAASPAARFPSTNPIGMREGGQNASWGRDAENGCLVRIEDSAPWAALDTFYTYTL